MKTTKEKPNPIRANVSNEAIENINRIRGEQMATGNKMNQEETIEFMLENYNKSK